jgi:ribosome-binding protein aMBF1 (putative translation factor)
MVKLSELQTAEEIHQEDMRDPEYASEYDRTKLANEVALAVTRYRAEHHLTQAALARRLGMRQPAIARIEAADHEPSLSTLSRLSRVLKVNFSIDITPDKLALRVQDRARRTPKVHA